MSDTRAKTPAPADETPGETCRRLIRSARSAALATLAGDDAADEPYASLVLVAAAQDGCPILLLSDLADHSRNIARDDRVSLLFDDTADLADPLTGARVSVQGRAACKAAPGRKTVKTAAIRCCAGTSPVIRKPKATSTSPISGCTT
jgi:putative heme iron utilization protein